MEVRQLWTVPWQRAPGVVDAPPWLAGRRVNSKHRSSCFVSFLDCRNPKSSLSLSLSLSLLPPHPSVSLSLSLFISIYFSLFSSPGLPVGRSGTSTQRTWTMLIDAPSRPSGTIWNVFFSLPSSKSFSRSPRCRAAVVQHLLNKNPFTRRAQKRRSCPKKRSFTTIPWLVNSF